MKTTLTLLAIIAGLLLAPLGMNIAQKSIGPKTSSESVDPKAKLEVIPQTSNALEAETEVKIQAVKKIITLEDKNNVTIRGPITGSSVAKAIKQLREASRKVSKDTPIYLTLDTPGGDIDAGTDLIDFAKALPQKIYTVTLFAASMGFQIVQNLDTRYIITNGRLMSHRAKVGGLGGQLNGEFETRYRMIHRTVEALDFIAAKRMGMDVKAYQAKILNEYWVYGFDAVGDKAADEEVLVRCGESLDGTDVVAFETMFGTAEVTFSKCPLIKEPEAINMQRISLEHQAEALKALKMAISEEKEFVDQYITTDKFHEIFR